VSLVDRVLNEPELRAAPPVLVDVGAAGGVLPAWRTIARHSIGVGFEPDARGAAPLDKARRMFGQWFFCPGLAVPTPAPDGRAALHLTRSPQCSSTLEPRAAALGEWAFADFFDVGEIRSLPAVTIEAALAARGIGRVDWLKCDTQGLDLKLYLSLPGAWRARMLAVEFEPGLIDAYKGEDKLADVLSAMEREPFWLSELKVGRTPRGRPALVAKHLGAGAAGWFRRLGPDAPGWANVRFLRDPAVGAESLDRRAHLLGWVFATLVGQHGCALATADAGTRRFGGGLFAEMTSSSAGRLRRTMALRLPMALWRRLTR